MKLRVINDNILVKYVEQPDITKGGIIIPDTAKTRSDKGVVMAVGQGRLLKNGDRVKPSVKKNDTVRFNRFVGSHILISGEAYFILKEENIMGVEGGL